MTTCARSRSGAWRVARVLDTVGRDEIAGMGGTLGGALEALANHADALADEYIGKAIALRRAAQNYRRAQLAYIAGVNADADHQNDNAEGEDDDGRPDDDFEVGEKG